MTSKERFLTALLGGKPDRIPITEHLFSQKLLQEVLGYSTILYDGKAQAELVTKLGIDGLWIPIIAQIPTANVKSLIDTVSQYGRYL